MVALIGITWINSQTTNTNSSIDVHKLEAIDLRLIAFFKTSIISGFMGNSKQGKRLFSEMN